MRTVTPQHQWDLYRSRTDQDMYEYSPFLREVARGNILEIGVNQGVSTSAFLLGLEDKQEGHLWSIDIDPDCNRFRHPRWTFMQGDSKTIPVPQLALDVLFIDGDHRYDAVSSDLMRFAPLVKQGGLILMHDVDPDPKLFDSNERWLDGRQEIHQYPPLDPCNAMQDFLAQHPSWDWSIMPGRFGLGVITVGL
jgi:predicted O-methyltransferase YrrM